MNTILNLTQHTSTPEQKAQGVVDLSGQDIIDLKRHLTFNDLPTFKDLVRSSRQIALLAHKHGANTAMIGGAPFFMSVLEDELKLFKIQPVYAFSERVSEDIVNSDGSITKVTKFKHLGFYHAKQ